MPPLPVNDETVTALLPYASLFSRVSLPGALITDDGLYDLARLPNLRKLYLAKTCIKGPGLAYLQSLPDLEELNLSFTLIDDAGALNLLHLDQVARVFVYGTEVQQNVLDALNANLSGVEILRVEGPYF